jgi:hypothetical protein
VRTAGANDPTTPRYPVAVPTSTDLDGEAGTVYLYWVEPTDNGGLNLGNPDIQYQVRTGTNIPWRTGINAWLDIGEDSHIAGATASAITFITTAPGGTAPDIAQDGTLTQGVLNTTYNASVTVANPDVGADHVDLQYRFRTSSKQETADNTGKTSGWVLFNSGRGVDMQPDNANEIPNMPGIFNGEPLSGSTANDVGIRMTWNAPDRDDSDDGINDRPPGGDYRIDWSDDGVKWQLGQRDTLRINEWKHRPLADSVVRYYRIFSKNGNHFSVAADGGMKAGTLQASGSGAGALAFMAEGISSTEIKLTWNKLDGAGCYNIFGADVDTVSSGPAGGLWVQLDANGDDTENPGDSTDALTFTEEDLTKGQQRWYRIDTYPEGMSSGACTGGIVPNASGITVLGQTKDEVGRLAAPLNLVAEVAKDSSGEDAAQRGVLLQWLRPLEAAGVDDPAGYAIQVSTDDGLNWAPVTGNTGTTDTIYRHASPLVGDEQRIYQVRSASGDTTILSDWGNESYYPPMAGMAVADQLGMASNLVISFNTGGTITVTWDAADNAVGYIVIAVDRSDFSAKSAPVNPNSAGVTLTTLNLGELTVGNNYYVYVAATGSSGANTLSLPPLEVTAQ